MYIKIHYLIYPAVIGVVLALFVSQAVSYKFINVKPVPFASVKRTSTIIINSRKVLEDIVDKNIFNLASPPIPIIDNSNDNGSVSAPVAATLTNAKLIGVLISQLGDGIAVITLNDSTLAISVGKEKNGLKLVKLSTYEATVEQSGAIYVLRLERDPNSLLQQVVANKGNTTNIAVGKTQNILLKRSEIEKELKDLNKVLQSALVTPLYKNSVFEGYSITRMRPDSPLAKLGLQVGDVIVRINGEEIKTPDVLFGMLSSIDDISVITLDIIRKGSKNMLFIEIV